MNDYVTLHDLHVICLVVLIKWIVLYFKHAMWFIDTS